MSGILYPVLTIQPSLAQGSDPHSLQELWRFWSFDPVVIIGLFLSVLLYGIGWRTLIRRTGKPRSDQKQRAWLFAGGMGALVLALVSPIDGLAGSFFSAHMLQHMLLMLVAAPLMVLSNPLPALLLGLPGRARQVIGRGWRRFRWLRTLWHVISQPLIAWLLQAGLLWAWHVPGLYQAAIANDTIHALEHISFLGSALLFWWVTLHSFDSRRLSHGFAILFLFAAALPGGLLGTLLTLSPQVWYPIYTVRAGDWGVSALTDQQLAGAIMLAPSGLIYLLAALLMMKSWSAAVETKSRVTGDQEAPGKYIQ